MSKSEKIISAVDVGFGFTKYLQFNQKTNEYKPSIFPSFKSLAEPKNLGKGFLKDRNTVLVNHLGADFEVGPDVELMTTGYSQKLLNSNYIYSDEYAILMKGALKLCNLKLIDILVLGVPVNKLEEGRKYLESTWKGGITLDSVNQVHIERVIVVPQPLGGFAYHASQTGNINKLQTQRNLIIDPGYFTFDWLLVDQMKPMTGSGSIESGISFFLKKIADQIGENTKNYTTLNKIDKFFLDGAPFNYSGKAIDLEKYRPSADGILESAVQAMMSEVTDISNIDNIIVIGGASHIYLPAIKKHLKREVQVAKGKSFSNILGYFIIGQNAAKSKYK